MFLILLRLLNEAYESLNSHEYFGVVSLDLSKAFDTVNHRISLYKFHNYGIRGITHNILKSYLSKLMQIVYVNVVTSDHLPIKAGVPEGSVLSPLLNISKVLYTAFCFYWILYRIILRWVLLLLLLDDYWNNFMFLCIYNDLYFDILTIF